MAALGTSNIILFVPKVGQSPNAAFVNVTKCKAMAAAALLWPFPTQTHINLLLIYCSTNWNSIPQKLVLKRHFRTDKLSVQAVPSLFKLSRIRSGGEREWGQASIFHLYTKAYTVFLSCPASYRNWALLLSRLESLFFCVTPFCRSQSISFILLVLSIRVCQGWIYPP